MYATCLVPHIYLDLVTLMFGSRVQVMQLLILSILKISCLLGPIVLLSSLLLFTCSLWILQGKRWSSTPTYGIW